MRCCLGPPIIREGVFWSKEPLVCGPQRTLYPSCIVNNVIYNCLSTCLLMFRMDYKQLMMLQEWKRRRVDKPLFGTTFDQSGLFCKQPLVCGPQRSFYACCIESSVIYIGLRTYLLLFKLGYKYLMMLLEQKRRQLDESLFGTTYDQGGLFLQ